MNDKNAQQAKDCKWCLAGECCRDLASARCYECSQQVKAQGGYCEYYEREQS